jgi:hypothetical protein
MKVRILLAVLIACVMASAWGGSKEASKPIVETSHNAEVSGVLGSKTNPVRCDMPRGERYYLLRLRDADGKSPGFHRVGSFGGGPYGNILDGYEVKLGANTVMIFMDMYHPGYVETNAVPGFTIVNEL